MHCVHTAMRPAHQVWPTGRLRRFGLGKQPTQIVVIVVFEDVEPEDQIYCGFLR
jgi:hypothetical protein